MYKLCYKKPADSWIEALPLGNGRLGAMVDGHPIEGKIQMNEESVVYGGPVDRLNQDALAHLPDIRKLIKEGRIEEAEELEVFALSGVPQSERPYQTLADFCYRMKGDGEKIHSYRRELDLETGIASSSFVLDGVNYRSQVFISKSPDVLAVEFEADSPGKITLSAILTRGRFYNRSGKTGKDSIFLDGDLGKGGSSFRVQAKAVAQGGTVKVIGEHLIIQGADKAVIYINGVTTFPYRREVVTDCKTYLEKQMSDLNRDSYEKLKEEHIRWHKERFGKSVLELEEDLSLRSLTTDERLTRMQNGSEDEGMLALYYAYGRYLLMCSSQPGGLPANLQGIWCEKLEPTWDSKYTININTQMNYWPAEICNLSECHEPLFDLLERMMENGKSTAEKMYGCRGFVAHHNTDIWADTAPQDLAVTATYWVMGGAWLATHIWKHYCYSRDIQFLNKMFPVLKSCVQFFLDYLIEDNGEMVTCPSVSPENTYIMKDGKMGRVCMGCTMDTAILKDVFSQYLKCVDLLEDNEDLRFQQQVRMILEKLPQYKVGKYGQLMEWREDYEEWEVGHRHFSHLYPLFPSNQINEYDTPELMDACRNALERRMKYGGGHTGWSCAWLVNLYARLQDGEQALKYLNYLLSKLTAPNMFDLHPPLERISGIPWVFQIDGNLGGTCGIAQLLLQSHLDEIFLLPALPKRWMKGKVTGLCAEGGYCLDISWSEHKLEEAVLYSKCGGTAIIRSKEKLRIVYDVNNMESELESGLKSELKEPVYRIDEIGRYILQTRCGFSYHLLPFA